MTNCAFYEIVYASEPLDDSDTKWKEFFLCQSHI